MGKFLFGCFCTGSVVLAVALHAPWFVYVFMVLIAIIGGLMKVFSGAGDIWG